MASVASRDVEQAQRWLRALADETRLMLVERLRDGEQCVCDLTDALDTGQSRLSFHLKTLKEAGIVTDRRVGRWVYYALNPEALDGLAQFVAELKPSSRALGAATRRC